MRKASLYLSGVLVATLALTACASRPPPAPASAAAPASASSANQMEAAPQTAPRPLPRLRKNAPVRYVVKRGDTLWSIASHFFNAPWLWPEIWYENPYIKNPHRIYPGEIIKLSHINGQPVLSVVTQCGTTVKTTAGGTRMLRPCIERTPLGKAVPTIPYDAIAALLSKPRVMDLASYRKAPYVLRSVGGELLAAAPGEIYARGLDADESAPGTNYAVVQKKKKLTDPKSGRTLGYEVLYLGRAQVERGGDPATLKLVQSSRGIEAGNRLVSVESGIVPAQFPLLTPKTDIHTEIIDVIGGLSEVGQYQVVVLDRGKRAGLETGDVLAIYTHGRRIQDPNAHGKLSSSVRLPDRRNGELVVFRSFANISYGLVMRALRPIQIGNLATNP
ncbi:MAG: LysM peptidoglycan-binding domain-containing protein [Gammaproteobacteria bacterium]